MVAKEGQAEEREESGDDGDEGAVDGAKEGCGHAHFVESPGPFIGLFCGHDFVFFLIDIRSQ